MAEPKEEPTAPKATPPPTAQQMPARPPEVSESRDRNINPADGRERVATPGVDPKGQVKQQDAAGNFIADENEIRAQREVRPETPRPSSAAVKTESKVNFNKRRIADLERQALDAENLSGQRRLQATAMLRAQIRELRERESRTYSGANIRTPRGSILHAEEAISQHPDYHYRYINISAAGKAENAQAMGYEKVPQDEGGKTVGDLALFRTPMERHAERVGARDVETKRKIHSVGQDLREEVREMAKFLRHKGVDIDENRLGVFGEKD